MKTKTIFPIFFLMILSLSVFVSAECTDSDNGNNENIKGTTIGIRDGTSDLVTKEDYCHTDFLLIEYFCRGDRGTLDGAQVPCPNGCLNGACLEEGSAMPICTDSDNGINSSVYGELEFRVGDSSSKKQDECVLVNFYDSEGIPNEFGGTDSCSGEDCYVQEYFCPKTFEKDFYYDGGEYDLIKCSYGCNSGACLPKPSQNFWQKIIKWFKSIFN